MKVLSSLINFDCFSLGQLGTGDQEVRVSPNKVLFPAGIKIEKVFCGYGHTFFLSSRNLLFATGKNEFGQCCQPKEMKKILSPVVVELSRRKKIVNVVCGFHFTFIQTSQHELFCWGWNKYGMF